MNQIELEKHNAVTPPDRSRENERQHDAAVTAEYCLGCARKAKFLILQVFAQKKQCLWSCYFHLYPSGVLFTSMPHFWSSDIRLGETAA